LGGQGYDRKDDTYHAVSVVVEMVIASSRGLCHVTRVQAVGTGGARVAVVEVVTVVVRMVVRVGVAAIAARFDRRN